MNFTIGPYNLLNNTVSPKMKWSSYDKVKIIAIIDLPLETFLRLRQASDR